MSWFLDFLAGALTGVLSGMGLGGGTLLMIYMAGMGGLAQHTAQGINLLYFIPCSLSALRGHVKTKQIDWKAVLPAIPAGLASSGLAAWLAQGLDGGVLRKIFGAGIIVIGVRELFKKR